MNIKQIIFPTILKNKSIVNEFTDEHKFDWWVIGKEDKIILMTKCPICFHTYNLKVTLNGEEDIKKDIIAYTPYYYHRIIRECPKRPTHYDIEV